MLPDGAYELRVLCATSLAALAAVPEDPPVTAIAARSPSDGGCSLAPGGGGSRAAALAVLGNLGLPLVVLLVLRLWGWQRARCARQ
jgi:hypothetical protein